ncbi:carbamoyltransferase HypF [Streptacidiphilus neutrinimicus]|uniref:carbamoyltransferase HypF n=1 Tax=Streptacidiphilus neutrinimicus TaxID=105420 RepID=UPI0005A61BF4|nr:carbamoyltransferase HypF [Streptacidiphilus neutrinimicus]
MTAPAAAPAERRRVTVQGVVQGVGFRPYVFGLANELRLTGYVTNTAEGVIAEVEGAGGAVAAFCARLAPEAPPLAVVQSVSHEPVAVRGDAAFTIEASREGGARRTLVSPDTATCDACLAELRDPDDPRHRHPFVTCTHCGPRFTIVTGLPYDRANTTMAGFPMCPRCAGEYQDPADRRFHAQPVACHACGPRLRLLVNSPGGPVEREGEPVAAARRLLAQGAIVAVKGLGGYHLACDAADARAVAELRRRKARGAKPFALMAADPDEIATLVRIGPEERALLTGARRPIVLLRRRRDADASGARARALVADAVAPGSPDLGVMLPYTPVHHLLLGLPGDPPGPRLLVMTSGNLGGEPIVTDEADALGRLAPLADAWLTHDRPIHVPCDDSVVRVVDGEELLVRRSRGYAPFPVALPFAVAPTLAVGGDLKNAFCLGRDRHAWLSAHIGDMDDLATVAAFEGAERQLESISGVAPERLAADLHPGYRSATWARRNAQGRPLRTVQHHHAHIASVLAENGWQESAGPVLGVAFDGTGYGEDGTVWGGEVLLADYDGFRRLAHLAEAPLPGGDAAVHRPYRMALAHLYAAGLPWTPGLPCVEACGEVERRVLARQLERGLNCVPTSSAGRLFDAVSALAGVCQEARYEAQAAIELEAAACAWDGPVTEPYRFDLRPVPDAPLRIDAAPVLRAVVADVTTGVDARLVAARFHAGLAASVREVCRLLRERTGVGAVALSGGVFANALLLTASLNGLREDGFTVLRHRLVPPNDGGLALGQLAVAARP